MPPKADYWKHLNVVGVVAYSLIAECQQPNAAAVERLCSAAGLIPDAKRSKLDPAWVDHILFLREAFLLGTCKLEWE